MTRGVVGPARWCPSVTAMECWKFAKFPFDFNMAEVAEQGYRKKGVEYYSGQKGQRACSCN